MSSRAVASPTGPLTLTVADGALVEVTWGTGAANDPDPVLDAAVAQLADYFAGRRRDFDLPLAPQGTAFQQRVWQALQRIPYGATWTYGELAAAVNSHPRAVGGACGANPLPIVVPCHRVTAGGGKPGGFSGGAGLATKHRLLALEGVTLPF